jgi:hypothetical protein
MFLNIFKLNKNRKSGKLFNPPSSFSHAVKKKEKEKKRNKKGLLSIP